MCLGFKRLSEQPIDEVKAFSAIITLSNDGKFLQRKRV
jgi:hypothetical protein